MQNEMGDNYTEETPSSENPTSDMLEDTSASDNQGETTSGGDTTDGKKMYTEEEVSEIIHKRTKEYAKMRDEYNAYKELGDIDELKKLKSQLENPTETSSSNGNISEEDKVFKDYLKKIVPEIENVENLKPETLEILQSIAEREQQANEAYISECESSVDKYAKEMNISEDKKVIFRDMVAAAILNDENLNMDFQMRKNGVIDKAVEIIRDNIAKGVAEKKMSDLATDKKKEAKVKGTLPSGGTSEKVEPKKKLTDEELVDLAFRRLSKGE